MITFKHLHLILIIEEYEFDLKYKVEKKVSKKL